MGFLLALDAGCVFLSVFGWACSADLTIVYPWLMFSAAVLTAAGGILVWKNLASPRSWPFLIVQLGFVFWYLLPMFKVGLAQELEIWDTRGPQTGWAASGDLLAAAIAVYTCKLFLEVAFHLLSKCWVRMPGLFAFVVRLRPRPIPTLVTLTFFGIGLIPVMLSPASFSTAILHSRAAGGLFAAYFQTGGLSPFLLMFFLHVSTTLGFVRYLADKSRISRYINGGLALSSALLLLLSMGTRSYMLLLFGPVLTFRQAVGNKRSIRWLITSALLAVAMAGGSELLVRYRTVGFNDFEEQRSAFSEMRVFVDNNFYVELVHSMVFIPEARPFTYESPILVNVARLIPGYFWPDRPSLQNYTYIMLLRTNGLSAYKTGNVAPGILGQYWQVAGWLGILIVAVHLSVIAHLCGMLLESTAGLAVKYLALQACWVVFVVFRTFGTSDFVPILLCTACFGAFAMTRGTQVQR
jgi:hypothetical protein